KESNWDALGNLSLTERGEMAWSADGKNLLSYQEIFNDSHGNKSTRSVSNSTYDDHQNLLSYDEKATAGGEVTTRHWGDASYEKFPRDGKDQWRLLSYKETSTDALGRESKREWSGAKYDEKGALSGYSDKQTGPSGEESSRNWNAKSFDKWGNIVEF